VLLTDLLDLLERTESFLLWPKKFGGDFIEKPDLVLPESLVLRSCFGTSFKAVCALVGGDSISTFPARDLDMERSFENEKEVRDAMLCIEFLLALVFWISSSIFGPFPATGYDPVTEGVAATAAL
jgi:hypothetical protein